MTWAVSPALAHMCWHRVNTHILPWCDFDTGSSELICPPHQLDGCPSGTWRKASCPWLREASTRTLAQLRNHRIGRRADPYPQSSATALCSEQPLQPCGQAWPQRPQTFIFPLSLAQASDLHCGFTASKKSGHHFCLNKDSHLI